jgi:hypothetical protein
MSNIDTRMQTFHNKGYHDAMNDCNKFLFTVSKKFGHMKFDSGLTLDRFMCIVVEELNKTYGIPNRKSENPNVE